MADSEEVSNEMAKGNEENSLGCDHYRRKCAFISPCCGKEYICRVCHNDKEVHEIDRHKVEEVRCLKCSSKQKVQKVCENCGIVFGNYFCETCRLYDDTERGQFHCDGCGICRIGGREKYFHCKKCDMCLLESMKDDHKCLEKASRSNCPVCMEDLHTSRKSCHIPPCGHLIHSSCFKDLLKSGRYACPICNTCMLDMQEYWKELDHEISVTAMPEEYRDMKVHILCRDCHKFSYILFHVLGLKCQNCGSYNTCRTADPNEEPPKPPGGANGQPGAGAGAGAGAEGGAMAGPGHL